MITCNLSLAFFFHSSKINQLATSSNNGSLHQVPAVNPVLAIELLILKTGRSSQGAWAVRLREAAWDPSSLQRTTPDLVLCVERLKQKVLSAPAHTPPGIWPTASSVLSQVSQLPACSRRVSDNACCQRRGSKGLTADPTRTSLRSGANHGLHCRRPCWAQTARLSSAHRELKASVGHLRSCLKS